MNFEKSIDIWVFKVALMTDLVNQVLTDGTVPEALLVGKMTLIDKKVPSLLVNQMHSQSRVGCLVSSLRCYDVTWMNGQDM